jgi:hypothetical protein
MADEGTNPTQADSGMDDFDLPLTRTSSPDEGGPPAQDPNAPAQPAQTQDPAAASGLPAELWQAMREENLRVVPGETTEQAYARMTLHLNRKNGSYKKDLARERERNAQELAALRESLKPMLLDHWNRQRQEALELQAAQIPEKGTPEYQEWLLEEGLRRDEARRREDWEAAQARQRAEIEQQAQGELAQIDAQGYDKIARGLGLPGFEGEADQEFAHAYDVYSNMAYDAATSYFPDAEPAQIHEFVALSQQLDIRRAEMNGVDYRDVLKGRLNGMISALEQMGLVQRVGKNGQAAQPAPTNGNGQGGGQQPNPGARPGATPSTMQRVSADAQAAQRRGPVAVASSGRPSSLPGQMPDADAFEDADDYVEAVLAGLLGNEEQRAAKHRKAR